MYRCESCDHLFEEGEQAVWEERHGLDSPPYEKFSGCPVCKGDYEEVHQCKGCGDWHTMEYEKVWKIIAELMETLQVINPRLYAGVIKKLKA